MRIVDLSMTLSKETPTYPGDPKVEIKPWASIEKDGYYMNALSFGEHSGTHVDAPAHFLENGKTVDELSLDLFIGEGVVLDLHKGDELPQRLEKKIVLLLTGGGEITPELAEKLVGLGVKAVGTDGESIGDERVHKVFLSHGIPIYENLRNLKKLVGKRFTFIGFPLKIAGGSGSPVRAVAVLED